MSEPITSHNSLKFVDWSNYKQMSDADRHGVNTSYGFSEMRQQKELKNNTQDKPAAPTKPVVAPPVSDSYDGAAPTADTTNKSFGIDDEE